jgi:hypothetical protein
VPPSRTAIAACVCYALLLVTGAGVGGGEIRQEQQQKRIFARLLVTGAVD